MATDVLLMSMVTYIQGNGKVIELMVMEYFSSKMDQNTLDSGWTINNMEMALRVGQMVQSSSAIIVMAQKLLSMYYSALLCSTLYYTSLTGRPVCRYSFHFLQVPLSETCMGRPS